MTVAETRAIGGGAQLTFFPAVSGHPDEGRRLDALAERRYNEEAEKQGKIRRHFPSKEG
jgi:hypothetical protein